MTDHEEQDAAAVDLGAVIADADTGEGADGVHWTLERAAELNANLVRLEPGHAVGRHVNAAVDVLVVVLAGSGTVVIDDAAAAVGPHAVVDVPRGTAREVRAGADGLWYLTVHRRRSGPTIGPTRR